jgi:hypothetical protein
LEALNAVAPTFMEPFPWLRYSRVRLKCNGTRAETIFRLSAKRKGPFNPLDAELNPICHLLALLGAHLIFHVGGIRVTSEGASIQSTTGSRVVRTSGSNAGYTMFQGSVKGTGYPLHSSVSPSLPLPCVTVCHDISTGLYPFDKWPLKSPETSGYCTEQTHYSCQESKPGLPPCKQLQRK